MIIYTFSFCHCFLSNFYSVVYDIKHPYVVQIIYTNIYLDGTQKLLQFPVRISLMICQPRFRVFSIKCLRLDVFNNSYPKLIILSNYTYSLKYGCRFAYFSIILIFSKYISIWSVDWFLIYTTTQNQNQIGNNESEGVVNVSRAPEL